MRLPLLAVLMILASATQQAPIPKTPDHPPPASSDAYVIGSQDLLTITVFDEPELSSKYRVDTDGVITFPLIGHIVASGLTLRDLQEEIAKRLNDGFMRNAQVRVDVDQYKSQSVFVIGEVRSPGKLTMTGRMALIEALALAGSPTTAASNELVVVHPKRPQPGEPTLPEDDKDAEMTRINIKELQMGRAGQNVTLQDGDTIFVPKAQTFFITGHVKNPGSYIYESGLTVLQAISLAGGLSDRGSDRRIKIVRTVDNKRVEASVELPDPVKPGDTIQIPQRFF